MVDNRTCDHEAGCLEGSAIPVRGRGRRLMVAIVSVETVLLVLLLVLVAGLLRSHAEILRRLGPAGERPDARRRSAARALRPRAPGSAGAAAGRPDPGRRRRRARLRAPAATPTLLAFLTSGCSTCAGFWETLGEPRLPAGVRDRDRHPRRASASARRALRELAPAGVPVVMSSQAWQDYAVPGAPYFVLVDGAIRGEGVATSLAGARLAGQRRDRGAARIGGGRRAGGGAPSDDAGGGRDRPRPSRACTRAGPTGAMT